MRSDAQADDTDVSALVSIDQLLDLARTVVDPGAYIWADAAAGEEVTARRNRIALNRLALMSRVLVDVGKIDTTTSFVGVPLALPVVMAPVGALSLYHPDGAMGSAAAAAAAGTASICGMLVSDSWEELAATAPGRHLFQLYVGGDRGWLADVIGRVEAAQYSAIVVSADSPVIGRRDRALIDGFTWSHGAHERPENLAEHGYDMKFRKSVTWADMDWICANSSLPVVLKGVLSTQDARRAVDGGAAGIYVSNHGGRTLDQSVSSIEVLAEIVDEVDGAADVMIDGGFQHGPDVLKALALGAKAVAVGRLQCWALAVGGQLGVDKVLDILRAEIETSLANLGCARLADLGPDRVRWSIPTIPTMS
jgi:isopentenyl diphosphate isomerase/L-lactate dehydrogenase-like FMN-dependent dehydrogenase